MALESSLDQLEKRDRQISPSQQRARDGVKWAREHPEEMRQRFALHLPEDSPEPSQPDPLSVPKPPPL